MTRTSTISAAETAAPVAPPTLRTSLARAIADGRALLEQDGAVKANAFADHCPARTVPAPHPRQRARTIGASGAVMAVSLGVGADEYAHCEEFAPAWAASLSAVKEMSTRCWSTAWSAYYGCTGTADIPNPDVAFESRMEAALDAPWENGFEFRSRAAYRVWLDHCENEVLEALATIEETLTADRRAARALKPPETLAETLKLALADARALARKVRTAHARYDFRSAEWHTGRDARLERQCTVCVAGCVIAGTLGCAPTDTVHPDRFGHRWARALRAIDALRTGHWGLAFDKMHGQRRAGRSEFEEAMHTGACRKGRGEAAFRGITEFEEWLERAETVLLPAVTANEAQALAAR